MSNRSKMNTWAWKLIQTGSINVGDTEIDSEKILTAATWRGAMLISNLCYIPGLMSMPPGIPADTGPPTGPLQHIRGIYFLHEIWREIMSTGKQTIILSRKRFRFGTINKIRRQGSKFVALNLCGQLPQSLLHVTRSLLTESSSYYLPTWEAGTNLSFSGFKIRHFFIESSV